jgi:hypothetical protein
MYREYALCLKNSVNFDVAKCVTYILRVFLHEFACVNVGYFKVSKTIAI